MNFFRRFLPPKLQLWQTTVFSKLRQNLLVGAAKILVMIGRVGMDSSRSGLLSTLLMTLPLIVVPAVALLRPPGQAGLTTVDLDASEGDSIFDEFEDFDADPSGAFKKEGSDRLKHDPLSGDHHDQGTADEFDIFEDAIHADTESLRVNARREPSAPHSPPKVSTRDPFLPDSAPKSAPPANRQENSPSPELKSDLNGQPNASQIVEELNAKGALKTMWFEAGDRTPVGLAVFFRGQTELTRIRFEAVGPSRDDCARNVLEQVTRWQQQNPIE